MNINSNLIYVRCVIDGKSATVCSRLAGGWVNIKMSSYQYRKSHRGDKTFLRPSYFHNGISYTGKTTFLYWIWDLMAIAVYDAIQCRQGKYSLWRFTYYKKAKIAIKTCLYCWILEWIQKNYQSLKQYKCIDCFGQNIKIFIFTKQHACNLISRSTVKKIDADNKLVRCVWDYTRHRGTVGSADRRSTNYIWVNNNLIAY